MKRFAALCVLLLFLALSAQTWGAPQTAQGGEIIRAEYGYGNKWTDVTQRVYSLARGNVLRFRADDTTLGVTSRPGAESSLRIQIRQSNGQIRRLTFRENRNVNLRGYTFDTAAFGGLRILRAIYAYESRSLNVTDLLNSQIRDGRLYLKVTNDNMGSDPASGRDKTLTVRYLSNGREDTVVVKEGEYLDLSGGTNAGRYNLQITRARYGSSTRSNDVTNRLSSQIRNGQLSLRVDNDTMGGDPDRDRAKTLTVNFTLDGRADQITVNEGSYLNLPTGTSTGSYNLQITRARYGSSTRSNDVTNRLNSQIRNGQLSLRVDNDTMGGDPDANRAKTLTVNYTLDGRADQITVNEGSYLNLPSGTSTGSYNLQITRARYGSSTRSNDVTNRLNSQIRNGQLSLRVDNDTMGGDPDRDRAKTLTVNYTLDGRADQITVNEGSYLNLPGGTSTGSYNLQITRARYGSSTRSNDVTNRLNSQIRDGHLSLRVDNDTMGGDPDRDRAKTLTVNYTLDGRSDQVTVNEGQYLHLPLEYGTAVARTVRCESANDRRNYCSADTRGGVRLTRQLSNANCVRGSSWDYDQNGIWVDQGCRADFEVLSSTGSYSGSVSSQRLISSGTQLSIRTNEVIDSKTAREGQRFSAVVEADVLDNTGALAVPKGSDVELVIRSTENSDLVLDIDSFVVAGQRYIVSTTDLERKNRDGIGANQRTAVMVGGGAAIGALIGAIVGGAKGAAIGAAIGAAGGAGAQVLTKGKEVSVPSETVLNFRLEQDLYLARQP